jgi:hypothetical protein
MTVDLEFVVLVEKQDLAMFTLLEVDVVPVVVDDVIPVVTLLADVSVTIFGFGLGSSSSL